MLGEQNVSTYKSCVCFDSLNVISIKIARPLTIKNIIKYFHIITCEDIHLVIISRH